MIRFARGANIKAGVRGFSSPPTVPFLKEEVWKHWRQAGAIGQKHFVDATAGDGLHAKAFLELEPTAKVLCMDVDEAAIASAKTNLKEYEDRVAFYVGSYTNLPQAIEAAGFPRHVDGVFCDLGIAKSVSQLGDKGLSFKVDAPLDMRLDPTNKNVWTASKIVSHFKGRQLGHLFQTLGGLDSETSERIVKGIIGWRGKGIRRRAIVSTLELRYVIEQSLKNSEVPLGGVDTSKKSKIFRKRDKRGEWGTNKQRNEALVHLAATKPKFPDATKKVFQALRIAVNREHESLQKLLQLVPHHLAPQGTFAALSFDPRTDEVVSTALQEWENRCYEEDMGNECRCGTSQEFRVFPPPEGVRPPLEFRRQHPQLRSLQLRGASRSCLYPRSSTPATDMGFSRNAFSTMAGVTPTSQIGGVRWFSSIGRTGRRGVPKLQTTKQKAGIDTKRPSTPMNEDAPLSAGRARRAPASVPSAAAGAADGLSEEQIAQMLQSGELGEHMQRMLEASASDPRLAKKLESIASKAQHNGNSEEVMAGFQEIFELIKDQGIDDAPHSRRSGAHPAAPWLEDTDAVPPSTDESMKEFMSLADKVRHENWKETEERKQRAKSRSKPRATPEEPLDFADSMGGGQGGGFDSMMADIMKEAQRSGLGDMFGQGGPLDAVFRDKEALQRAMNELKGEGGEDFSQFADAFNLDNMEAALQQALKEGAFEGADEGRASELLEQMKEHSTGDGAEDFSFGDMKAMKEKFEQMQNMEGNEGFDELASMLEGMTKQATDFNEGETQLEDVESMVKDQLSNRSEVTGERTLGPAGRRLQELFEQGKEPSVEDFRAAMEEQAKLEGWTGEQASSLEGLNALGDMESLLDDMKSHESQGKDMLKGFSSTVKSAMDDLETSAARESLDSLAEEELELLSKKASSKKPESGASPRLSRPRSSSEEPATANSVGRNRRVRRAQRNASQAMSESNAEAPPIMPPEMQSQNEAMLDRALRSWARNALRTSGGKAMYVQPSDSKEPVGRLELQEIMVMMGEDPENPHMGSIIGTLMSEGYLGAPELFAKEEGKQQTPDDMAQQWSSVAPVIEAISAGKTLDEVLSIASQHDVPEYVVDVIIDTLPKGGLNAIEADLREKGLDPQKVLGLPTEEELEAAKAAGQGQEEGVVFDAKRAFSKDELEEIERLGLSEEDVANLSLTMKELKSLGISETNMDSVAKAMFGGDPEKYFQDEMEAMRVQKQFMDKAGSAVNLDELPVGERIAFLEEMKSRVEEEAKQQAKAKVRRLATH